MFSIPFKILILASFLSFASVAHSKRVSHVTNYGKEKSAIKIPFLEERVGALKALSELHPAIIPLSLKQYRQLVYPAPRNFSVFVLFTNGNNDKDIILEMEEYQGCAKCEEASTWWRHVVGIHFIQEWRRAKQSPLIPRDEEERLYFAAVNIFPENNGKYKVPLDFSKPNFVYFANTTGSKGGVVNNTRRIWKLNVSQFKNDEFPRSMHILDLITWIEECSGVFINLRTQPPTLTRTGGSLIWGGVFACCYILWRFCNVVWLLEKAWEIVQKLNYKYFAVLIATWCVSGQMFNQIRQTGWAYWDSDNNIVFIYGGQRYQMLSESLIIMALYAVNVSSMIQLIEQAKQAIKGKKPFDYHSVMYYCTGWTSSFAAVLYIVKLKN